MARMQIEGPYRVLPPNEGEGRTEWEIVELVNGKPVQLRPRVIYAKEKRTSAYRRLALLNRKWQKARDNEQLL